MSTMRDSSAYVPPPTSSTPLVGVTQPDHLRNDMICVSAPANSDAASSGATYPVVYVSRSAPPARGANEEGLAMIKTSCELRCRMAALLQQPQG